MYKTLWFTHKAYQDLMRLASQAADGLETGGMFFGYDYPDQEYAAVTDVHGIGPDSRRTPDDFNIGRETVGLARAKLWSGYRFEIGAWHTHPFSTVKPSQGDDQSIGEWRSLTGWDRWQPAIEVIVGVPPRGTPQQAGAWYYTPNERIALQIKVADADWQPPIDEDGNWIEQQQGVS